MLRNFVLQTNSTCTNVVLVEKPPRPTIFMEARDYFCINPKQAPSQGLYSLGSSNRSEEPVAFFVYVSASRLTSSYVTQLSCPPLSRGDWI